MPAIPKFPLLLTTSIMLLLDLNGTAQQPKVLAPHRPINPRVPDSQIQHHAVERSLVGGFWMIDANRKATIYLKNSMETSPLTVAPLLYLSNGARYSLTPVTIEASGTAVVSINDALEKQGIAPYSTLSGYLEVQYMWAWDPICATVVSVDPIHSVIFTYGLVPSDATKIKHVAVPPRKVIDGRNAVEGMWWKPEANVTGFVALSNTSSAAAEASVLSSDSHNNVLAEQSVHIAPHVTKIVKLDELVSVAPGTVGGLRILYSGRGDGMVISGGLEDQTSGYSAILPFHLLGSPPAEQTGTETYAELGLMTGQADPMIAFPPGTVFTPFSVVRNVGDQPLQVTPSLYWMQGGQARSARLPSFTMGPFETQTLDVRGLQSAAGLKGFNGSINVTFDAQGQARSLLLASGSVDQKNNYVFQVAPHSVQESASKSVSYWSTANGDDTMVTVWNPADEGQDYIFTLLYSGGHYRIPIHLEPRATQTFNIAEIVQNPTPDAEGNVIPPTVRDGSAMIAGTHADNEGILVGLDAGTYNVRKATCTYYCITCNGWWTALLTGTPFTIPKGSGTTLQLQDQWNTGATYSLSGNYASNNTAVATIGATNGTVNGIAPGSPNFTGTGNDFVYISNYCAVDPICNSRSSPQGSGGGTVVSATISQRTSSTVSSDDAALSSYQNAVGTTNLGNIIENGNVRGCGIGLETIGSVAPSNYTGSVIMHRTIVNQGLYVNSTDAGGETPANTDDTSPSNFRDDNPQSGGSAGKVYDLDGPGLHPSAVDGKTYRYRTNFSAYATLSDGTLISPSPGFFFYVRLSCQLTGPGYVFINDVPGDNQIGIGTTNTTWNLQ